MVFLKYCSDFYFESFIIYDIRVKRLWYNYRCLISKMEDEVMQKVISTKNAPSAIGPYSQAIEINGMVYTSGVIPVVPETGELPEGVEAQAEQAFKNLTNLVADSGSKVENIVKTTVFIKEMNDFGKINEIYKKYFKEPFPARSCVEVARLPKDVLLEVEAIAFK